MIWDEDYAGFVDWEVIYTVDYIAAKIPLTLYKSSCEESYKSGQPTWKHFLLNAIDSDNISRIALLNIASLCISAKCNETQILSLNMVVHVSRNENEAMRLYKTILNPIE